MSLIDKVRRGSRCRFELRRWWTLIAVLTGLISAVIDGRAQSLRDQFANREVITARSGELRGNNSSATVELGEPRHGGKPGGHSLWISWIAPDDGVVAFKSETSSFDTLMSAYYFQSTNDTGFEQLIEAAQADDSEGVGHESELKFGVLAGRRYEIAVDGYYGTRGSIKLAWSFEPTEGPPPVILASPRDRAVNFGDTLTLTVSLTNAAKGRYRWYRNNDILAADTPTLVISDFQADDVGRYRMRVIIDGPDFYSIPAEIQINTEGASEALAKDKVLDAIDSALVPPDGAWHQEGSLTAAALSGGVLRGYNGSQIFNTASALSEPDEPAHCGLVSSASYWFSYRPPADGTVTLDTVGSRFDTVLAVYTYSPPLKSYEGLIPIACDNDSMAPSGAARLEFAAVKGRQYAVVVAGVGAAKGVAALNYRLDSARPPVPPTLVQAAAPRSVPAGATITLEPRIAGSAPMLYAWRKDGTLIPGATNATLRISPAATAHSGNYTVTVSNFVGAPLQVSTPVRVLVPPSLHMQRSSEVLHLAMPTVAGQVYQLEQCETVDGPWQSLGQRVTGNGSWVYLTNLVAAGNRYFRLRVE